MDHEKMIVGLRKIIEDHECVKDFKMFIVHGNGRKVVYGNDFKISKKLLLLIDVETKNKRKISLEKIDGYFPFW